MKKQLLLLTVLSMALMQTKAQVMPTIIADGFVNSLIGVEVDVDGNIWVAEMGTGNDDGTITYIEPDGDKVVFMTGLPSGFNDIGELAGPCRTFQLPNNIVLVLVGEGPHAQAQSLLYVDKDDFTPGSPLTLNDAEQSVKIGDFVLGQGFSNSNPYDLAWDADGNTYVADAGGNSIIKRDQGTGNLSVFKTLAPFPNPIPVGPPFVDPVPTGIVAKPDTSGFYVCQLSGFPFLEGMANIYSLGLDGSLDTFAQGFTLLTDIGYDPKDGNLCVMQFSVTDTAFNFIPGMGRVIKVFPDGSRDTIGSGMIGLNPSFAFDAAGDMYATDLFGFVYKFDFPSSAGEAKPMAALVQASPNPFAESVTIAFDLDRPAKVALNIYDLHGRLVQAFPEQDLAAGRQAFTWDARTAQPGHYIYHLLIEGRVATGLLSLAR